MSLICKECKLALTYPHIELVWWRKCCSCGYTEFSLDEIPETMHKRAIESKMLTWNEVNQLQSEYQCKPDRD